MDVTQLQKGRLALTGLAPRNLVNSELIKTAKYNHLAQFAVIFILAVALKQYYSTARVNELRWILGPTAFLVEVASGRTFKFESFAGYMSSDYTFIIAASCAGVNFFITAFLMLSLRRLWSDHRMFYDRRREGQRARKTPWTFILFAALAAYLATLLANTVRISIALWIQSLPPGTGWLSKNQLHRVQGIFIYFGFLLLLFLVSEAITAVRLEDQNVRGRAGGPKAFGHFSRFVFPLLIYYATTFGIPLLNGAYRQGADFWGHSLVLFAIPLLLVLSVMTFTCLRQFCFHKSFRVLSSARRRST